MMLDNRIIENVTSEHKKRATNALKKFVNVSNVFIPY